MAGDVKELAFPLKLFPNFTVGIRNERSACPSTGCRITRLKYWGSSTNIPIGKMKSGQWRIDRKQKDVQSGHVIEDIIQVLGSDQSIVKQSFDQE